MTFKQELSESFKQYRELFEKKRYRAKKRLRYFAFRESAATRLRFVLKDFTPYVAAYGLVLAYVSSVFAETPLTYRYVLGFGFMYYMVEQEAVGIINEVTG